MDNLTKEQRRRNMQNIRSEGTSPEKIVRKELRKRRISFAGHVKSLLGKPDFVFKGRRVLLFVDSDFWHGHPKRCIMPKSNRRYWRNKILCNIARDKKIRRDLRVQGWQVLRIWEYDIKQDLERVMKRVEKALA